MASPSRGLIVLSGEVTHLGTSSGCDAYRAIGCHRDRLSEPPGRGRIEYLEIELPTWCGCRCKARTANHAVGSADFTRRPEQDTAAIRMPGAVDDVSVAFVFGGGSVGAATETTAPTEKSDATGESVEHMPMRGTGIGIGLRPIAVSIYSGDG